MIMEAVQHGTAEIIVDDIKNECGHTAWNTLIEWFESNACMVTHYQSKL